MICGKTIVRRQPPWRILDKGSRSEGGQPPSTAPDSLMISVLPRKSRPLQERMHEKGLFVSQFDETEASGLTREPVDGNRHRLGGKTVAFEPLMQLILVRLVGQIPYKYLLSQCSAAFLDTSYIDVNNIKCIVLFTVSSAAGFKEDEKHPLAKYVRMKSAARSPDGGERFEHDAFAVDPAIGRSGHDHAVFSAYLVGG